MGPRMIADKQILKKKAEELCFQEKESDSGKAARKRQLEWVSLSKERNRSGHQYTKLSFIRCFKFVLDQLGS